MTPPPIPVASESASRRAARLPRVDVHQHLWPEPLVAALGRRTSPPMLRRADGGLSLVLVGEPAAAFDPTAHDPSARLADLASDGVDRALLCLSSPLGIEALPRAEARPLLDAWHDGAFALGRPFGVWGAVGTAEPDARDVGAVLDRGAVGVSLPASALTTRERAGRALVVLAALERRDRPLLVHPGAAPAGTPDPPWWAASVAYVAELHAAWHGFAAWVRPALPRLRVVFAALAGCAAMHVERLAGRHGPVAAAEDPLVFYDTSSYGPRAIAAVARVVGVDQLVHGSDRPVLGAPPDPGLGAAAWRALTAANPARLLDGDAAPAPGARP